MNQEFEEIRVESMSWIREAGSIARDRLGSAVWSRKADRTVVTDVDHAVQERLLSAIHRRYPRDAAITEETQSDPARHAPVASARRCWVIDPLDGTRNYARALPIFTVSVALMEGGMPVVGLILEPMSGQLYSASAGGGAWLEDRRMGLLEPVAGAELILAVPSAREEPLHPVVYRWLERVVLRALGSTALHLALLAKGAVDAVFSNKCRIWDMAAGALMVQEAGGNICLHDGRPCFPMDLAYYDNNLTPFVAAAPALLEQLIAELRIAGPATAGP